MTVLSAAAAVLAFIAAGVAVVYARRSEREAVHSFAAAALAAAHNAEACGHASRACDQADDATHSAVRSAINCRQAEKVAERLTAHRIEAVPTDGRPLDSVTIMSETGPQTIRLSEVPMIGLAEIDDAN
jgi:hypothetical protein